MRLIVAYWSNGQTTTNRQSTGGESAASRFAHRRYRTTAGGPSGAAPGGGLGHVGANCCQAAALLGRSTQGPAQYRTRSAVPSPMGRAGQAGRGAGVIADSSGVGAALGPAGGRLGDVATVGTARVA